MAKPPLNENLYGLFYDVFKKVGIPLGIDEIDGLRMVTDKICIAIQNEVKEKMQKVAVITMKELKDLEERLSGDKLNGQEDIKKIGTGERSDSEVLPRRDED